MLICKNFQTSCNFNVFIKNKNVSFYKGAVDLYLFKMSSSKIGKVKKIVNRQSLDEKGRASSTWRKL